MASKKEIGLAGKGIDLLSEGQCDSAETFGGFLCAVPPVRERHLLLPYTEKDGHDQRIFFRTSSLQE